MLKRYFYKYDSMSHNLKKIHKKAQRHDTLNIKSHTFRQTHRTAFCVGTAQCGARSLCKLLLPGFGSSVFIWKCSKPKQYSISSYSKLLTPWWVHSESSYQEQSLKYTLTFSIVSHRLCRTLIILNEIILQR